MNVLSATDGSDASKAAEALFAAVVRREVVEVTVLSVTGASSGSGAGALSGTGAREHSELRHALVEQAQVRHAPAALVVRSRGGAGAPER
jgi:hypothetical protein